MNSDPIQSAGVAIYLVVSWSGKIDERRVVQVSTPRMRLKQHVSDAIVVVVDLLSALSLLSVCPSPSSDNASQRPEKKDPSQIVLTRANARSL